MRLRSAHVFVATLLAGAACSPAFAASHPHKVRSSSSSIRHASAHGKHAAVLNHHVSAPGMDTERATAIQTALIKQGYLAGEPTGSWDSDSVAAMQKLQSDNGWQTKYTPDARALLKLGLAHNDGTAVASSDTVSVATAAGGQQ